MYLRLLESIKEERQQLQLQFATPAAEPEGEPDPGPGTDTLRVDLRSRSSRAQQLQEDSFCGRHARLEAEQQRSARLQLLMQKEYTLRMGGMAWVVGCLSWPQMSRAAVLSWPFPVRMSLLAREVQKQWDLQQQWLLQQELGPPLELQQHGGGGSAGFDAGPLQDRPSSPNPTAAGAGCADAELSTEP